MTFQISVANLTIEIHSIFDYTYELCSDYLLSTTNNPDIVIKTTPVEIVLERIRNSQSSCNEIKKVQDYHNNHNDGYLETLLIYRKISIAALEKNTFLMHGVAIGVSNVSCLITAPSGVGKTTRAKLWLKTIPNSYIINGDKPLIHISEDKAQVCGTPWCGKENMNTNTIVPLKAILFLERSSENSVEKIPFSEALPILLQQTFIPMDGNNVSKKITLLELLDKQVSFYRFKSNLEDSAVLLANDIIFNH